MRQAHAAPIVLAFVLLAGCAGPTATIGLPPDAASGAACVRAPCSAPVLAGYHAEPGVAIAPHDPSQMLVATFGTDGSHAGSWAYIARSADGGATWTTNRAPDAPTLVPELGLPAGQLTIVADTVALWPEPGTLLVIALLGETVYTPDFAAYARPLHVVQWRSTDGGATWGDATIVARAEGVTGRVGPQGLHARWFDKPAGAHDLATGETHLLFHRISSFGVETLAVRSDDAGSTWSQPTVVPPMEGLYGASLTAHDGIVLATLANPGYRVLRSEDGARTWSEVAQMGDKRPGTGTWQSAPVGLWRAADGALHAVLARSEGDANERILLHTSADGGATWDAGRSIMPEAATERRNPVLALDPESGKGFVATLQADGDPERLATWAVPLVNGIAGTPLRISATPSDGGVFEYFGGAARGGVGVVAYPSRGEDETPLMAATLRLA